MVWINSFFFTMAGSLLVKFVGVVGESRSRTREFIVQTRHDIKRLERERDWSLFKRMLFYLMLICGSIVGVIATF